MPLSDQLNDYINAAFTGLWVETHEPDEAEREILQHARNRQWRIAVWDVARGVRLPGAEGSATDAGSGDPLTALHSVTATTDPNGTSLLLLHNFHKFLTSPEVIQTLFTQLIAGKNAGRSWCFRPWCRSRPNSKSYCRDRACFARSGATAGHRRGTNQ